MPSSRKLCSLRMLRELNGFCDAIALSQPVLHVRMFFFLFQGGIEEKLHIQYAEFPEPLS